MKRIIASVLAVMLAAWLSASWIDTVYDNHKPGSHVQSWNAFYILMSATKWVLAKYLTIRIYYGIIPIENKREEV